MTIPGAAEAAFTPLIEIGVDPERALVHEHGWQSWTPTTTYRFGERPHRPSTHHRRVMSWRPDRVAPAGAYQGEGLLVVDPGDGSPAHRFATFDPRGSMPSIRADGSSDRVSISATGPVRHELCPGGVQAALVGWAEELAVASGLGPGSLPAAPTMWCSWYGYWQAITDRVILDNAEDIERLDLPVDVVQIDDGYQAEIGDWTQPAPTFGSLRALADELLARGRRVGIWTAPFLVGERSDLARRRPEWLVGDTDLGSHWNQRLFALDVTMQARQHLLGDLSLQGEAALLLSRPRGRPESAGHTRPAALCEAGAPNSRQPVRCHVTVLQGAAVRPPPSSTSRGLTRRIHPASSNHHAWDRAGRQRL